jgi:peptide/nickel transport system substrate-binding protein
MAANAFFNFLLLFQIYEPLTQRGDDLRLEPGLATRWELIEPTRWRFHLRDGVRFAGGEPFTAEDAAFSIRRAAAPPSNVTPYVDTLDRVDVVDRLTLDVVTRVPDAVVPDKLARVLMMSRAWAETHRVERPQDWARREDSHAARNANGTGPYRLRARQPEQRTILARNPAWWGWTDSHTPRGNVGEFHHVVLGNDATRVAALLSGEVDMVHIVPPQDVERLSRDPRLRVVEGPEARTVFLGMDQERDELPGGGDTPGRNPFKDLRVRQAIAHAIDMETIRRVALRGQGIPAGSMWTRFVNGYDPDLDRRLPFDRARARALMAEAGYAEGFSVTLECALGLFDEACRALPPMLAAIGIRAGLALHSGNQFTGRLLRREPVFYGLSSVVTTYDAQYTLRHFMASRALAGPSSWNIGGYANPRVDALLLAVEAETDPERRRALIREAHAIHNAELGHIVLYQRVIPWAVRRGIEVTHRAGNIPVVSTIRVE